MQLRTVLERAGMLPYCDFVEKDSTADGDGRRLTPDVRVLLPNDASIVIDSKVPIDAYLHWTEADETVREPFLRDHARQVREHIRGLAGKSYWARFEQSPDFVVMFVPAEPLFNVALQKDPTLFDYAMDQRVIPASPLTLVALLRTIASAWQQQRMTQNAEQIQALGKELYERLCTMAEHVADIGDHLRQGGQLLRPVRRIARRPRDGVGPSVQGSRRPRSEGAPGGPPADPPRNSRVRARRSSACRRRNP